MLATWELPACLSEYSNEGHISNEGEDVVKRMWDLFSEIGTKATDTIEGSRGGPDLRNPPQNDNLVFERPLGVNGDQLRSQWEQQEVRE